MNDALQFQLSCVLEDSSSGREDAVLVASFVYIIARQTRFEYRVFGSVRECKEDVLLSRPRSGFARGNYGGR